MMDWFEVCSLIRIETTRFVKEEFGVTPIAYVDIDDLLRVYVSKKCFLIPMDEFYEIKYTNCYDEFGNIVGLEATVEYKMTEIYNIMERIKLTIKELIKKAYENNEVEVRL